MSTTLHYVVDLLLVVLIAWLLVLSYRPKRYPITILFKELGGPQHDVFKEPIVLDEGDSGSAIEPSGLVRVWIQYKAARTIVVEVVTDEATPEQIAAAERRRHPGKALRQAMERSEHLIRETKL